MRILLKDQQEIALSDGRISLCFSVKSWLTHRGATYPVGTNRTTNAPTCSRGPGSGCLTDGQYIYSGLGKG